jgi:hypothetical protein
MAEARLSEGQKKALKTYGEWRPRIGRGARFASTAGVITGLTGKRKLMFPAATVAGVAGVGDAMLEEKVQKNRQLEKLVGGAFDKKASATCEDPAGSVDGRPPWGGFTEGAEQGAVRDRQGHLEQLFSSQARLKSLAAEQLKDLFPAAPADSHGRSTAAAGSAADASRLVSQAFRRR